MKFREGFGISNFLEVENRLITLHTCFIFYKKKKKNKDDSKSGTLSLADRIWSCDPSKRGHDPTEVSAQVRKSNVTFLPGFSNVLRLVTAFSFSFLHFSEKMSVLDGRSIIVFGSKEHVFWFHRCTNGDEFCPRMDHTRSLIHTWLKWFGWWNLKLLSWWDLDEVFVSYIDYVFCWNFEKYLDGISAFYMCDRYEYMSSRRKTMIRICPYPLNELICYLTSKKDFAHWIKSL